LEDWVAITNEAGKRAPARSGPSRAVRSVALAGEGQGLTKESGGCPGYERGVVAGDSVIGRELEEWF